MAVGWTRGLGRKLEPICCAFWSHLKRGVTALLVLCHLQCWDTYRGVVLPHNVRTPFLNILGDQVPHGMCEQPAVPAHDRLSLYSQKDPPRLQIMLVTYTNRRRCRRPGVPHPNM